MWLQLSSISTPTGILSRHLASLYKVTLNIGMGNGKWEMKTASVHKWWDVEQNRLNCVSKYLLWKTAQAFARECAVLFPEPPGEENQEESAEI